MDWKDIRSLLSNPTRLLVARVQLKTKVIDIISGVINTPIPADVVTIKNGTVFLDCHPVVKSEIVLKKARIMELLRIEGLGGQISDIR